MEGGGVADEVGLRVVDDGGTLKGGGGGGLVEVEGDPGEEDEEGEQEGEGRRPLEKVEERRGQRGGRGCGGGGEWRGLGVDLQRDGPPRIRHGRAARRPVVSWWRPDCRTAGEGSAAETLLFLSRWSRRTVTASRGLPCHFEGG